MSSAGRVLPFFLTRTLGWLVGPGSCEYESDGSKEEGWMYENQLDLQPLMNTYAPDQLGGSAENGKGDGEKLV